MTLAPGTRLGPYQIAAPIGAGGMGEVYRARDTRVGREVAVKILPQDFAADPQRRRRFEQEARLAASLNHPNIVGLYDVGSTLDPPYIVSELVSGVSLRVVMSRGAIPLRKVLDLAAQMAEGLAAAHAAGVVHRDIKPENVMVTPEGRVKILDFGVARLQVERGVGGSATGAGDGATQTATATLETPRDTTPGMVVGTIAYMSPEQAAGQAVDFRSDQFSLGLVLYEMLVRRRAFERASSAQTMAAIIEDEAPALPVSVPTQVRWVLGRCLAKDPPHRYASTLDLARELRQLGEHASELTSASGESAVVKRRWSMRRIRNLAAGAAALALVFLAAGRLSVDEPGVDLGPYKLTPFATQLMLSSAPAWSPDGKSVAFIGAAEGVTDAQVWVQRLDAPAPVQITQPPFGALGGDPTMTSVLSWTPDSRMIYCFGWTSATEASPMTAGIFRIPASGGDPLLVQPDAPFGFGVLSPDGKTLLTFGPAAPGREKGVAVWFASPPDAPRRLYPTAGFAAFRTNGLSKVLAAFAPNGSEICVTFTGAGGPEYWLLPWPPGNGRRVFPGLGGSDGISWMPDSRHLVLASQPDPAQPTRLMLADAQTGRYRPLLVSNASPSAPSVSPDGTGIAYVSGLSQMDIIEMPINGGPPRTILGSSRDERTPALSASGKQLVYVGNPRGQDEVWSRDMGDGSLRRLLAPGDIPADAGHPVQSLETPELSPDGRRLAFTAGSFAKGMRLFTAFTAGGAPVRATTEENYPEFGESWSPDGNRLAYLSGVPTGFRLSVLRVGSSERPSFLLDSLYDVLPEWSPTGEWIAVSSSARDRVVLVSPDGRTRREMGSKGGGGLHAWSPDGRTLYVLNFDGVWKGRLTAIDVQTGAERGVRDLGGLSASDFMPAGQRISVTPDGKSIICGVRRARREIWLLEGVKVSRPWYARLWPW